MDEKDYIRGNRSNLKFPCDGEFNFMSQDELNEIIERFMLNRKGYSVRNMKIIFLDFDGVLNSIDWCEKNAGVIGFSEINPDKVKLLKEIVDRTGAKLVLSSTWRHLLGKNSSEADAMYQYLIDQLGEYELGIYDHTPYIHGCRPREINAWLESHTKIDDARFVSLDDDFVKSEYDEYGIGECLVSTSFWEKDGGIRREHVEIAVELLNAN